MMFQRALFHFLIIMIPTYMQKKNIIIFIHSFPKLIKNQSFFNNYCDGG